jgi:threonine dehydrogenase-like Zn-dependent dehydrogenase
MGAKQVIAIDTASARLEMACQHGATVALTASAADSYDEVMRLTNAIGVDVVYDITGAPAVFQKALRLVRRFGKLILLGDTGNPSEQRLTPDIVLKGLKIIGAHDSNPPPLSSDHAHWSHREMTNLFFTYLQRQDIQVADLITHRYPPQEASRAYDMLRTDRASAMGVVFDWTGL